MHHESRRVTRSSSRPYYVGLLVIERLEVNMNKMVNLLRFGCLRNLQLKQGCQLHYQWRCSVVLHLCQPWAEANCPQWRCPKASGSHGWSKTLKNRLKSFFCHCAFFIAHDQATSLISHNSCQTKSMIAEDLKFLEDQRCGRKMELGSPNKE